MKLQQKLSFISLITAVVITLPGLFILYYLARNIYLEKTFQDIANFTQSSAQVPINHIRRAENSLKTLSQELVLSLAKPPLKKEIAEFDALVSVDKYGVTRNDPKKFNGKRQAGVFIPAGVELSNTLKRTKLRAMKLLSIYGQASLQFFDGVWFDQADKTSVIFWRRDANFIYKLPPDHDYTISLWDTLASPKLNPERVAKWTPAIQESPVGTWVVSCVYPVDINHKWVGVVGHDIALTELLSSFKQQDNYHLSEHFLLDAYGNFILAGPWQKELEQKPDNFNPDLSHEPEFKALLQQKIHSNQAAIQRITLQGKDYVAVSLHISGLDWKYIRLVSIDEILLPMQKLFYSVVGLILFIGFLTFLFMNYAVRRLLVRPLINFADVLHQYGRGQYSVRLNHDSNDELGDMATTINSMSDNIQQQRQKLIRGKSRYQYVVNSINEVIFQLDQKGRITFINDAWQTLSGVNRHASFNQYLIDYIHPDSRLVMEQALLKLLQQPETSFLGEIRLRNNEQNIWVEIDMQSLIETNNENTSSDLVITGNMDNISARKQTQLTDDIISQLEQEALKGHSSEYILSLFCFKLSAVLPLDLIWVITSENSTIQVIAASGKNIHNVQHYNASLSHPDKLAKLQQIIDADHGQKLKIDDDTEYECLAYSLAIPDQDNVLVLFHSQPHSSFSKDDIEDLSRLIRKTSQTLSLAQEHKSMLLYRTAIENTANAVLITDPVGKIEWCNKAFTALTLYPIDEIKGETPRILNAGKQSADFYQKLWKDLNEQKTWRGEMVNKRKDGSLYTALETITPLIDELNITTHFIAVQEDLTDIKTAEEQTRFFATHDFLTELPNRYLFHERLQHAVDRAQRNKQQHALLFIDLDGFKTINDSLGHQIGDHLLQKFSKRLVQIVRKADTVARIGGDEFVILVENIQCIEDIKILSQKVLDSFKQPFEIAENNLLLTASIGVAIYPDDQDNANDLIQSADAAMYHAKDKGCNQCQFFTQKINDQIDSRLMLEHDLQQALVNEQFELHYQPQVDSQTKTVTGMEALIRWNHPTKGRIPPLDFIPFTEENGLIIELGAWVLRSACQQARRWHQAGYEELSISINVSVKQLLHSEFIRTLTSILNETQVDPNFITLELTESIMLNQPDLAVELLMKIKQLGIKLSIDDFGTGYSSLQYLRLLPIDELKIDQSFIRDIYHKNGLSIVQTICALGQSMELLLLAEGVEESDTVALLQQLGCTHIQGYLYSKPLTVADADKFLLKNNIKVTRNK
ncbi:MAG: EAL domain-containing protein [Methylococcales bacterium]